MARLDVKKNSNDPNLYDRYLRAMRAYNRFRTVAVQKYAINADLASTDITSNFRAAGAGGRSLPKLIDRAKKTVVAFDFGTRTADRESVLQALKDLREIYEDRDTRIEIPSQVPAPIVFAVTDDALRIREASLPTGPLEGTSVERLRKAGSEALSQAISVFKQSNVDRRFISACLGLRRQMTRSEDSFSAESAGTQYDIVVSSIASCQDGMPELGLVQLKTALERFDVCLDQYEDWKSFKAALATKKIFGTEAGAILEAAEEAASLIAAEPHLAEPEIPERIFDLTHRVADGLIRVEAVAGPLSLTMQNLLARASSIVLGNPDLVRIITEQAVSATLGNTTNWLIGLVTACVTLVYRNADRLSHIPEFGFLRAVVRRANQI